MSTLVFVLSLIFIPLAIPFVSFYVACKMVLNGLNKKLEEMGAEL